MGGVRFCLGLGWAPRERACARREALGKGELSRCALGEGLIASNARCGPIPLLPGDRESCGASPWVGFTSGVALNNCGVFAMGFCGSFRSVWNRVDGENERVERRFFSLPWSSPEWGILKFFGKVL
jgi:hypothetical protein